MQDAHAWSGRFSEPVSELVKKYTASVDFDKRMAAFDIQGSLAHAAALERADARAKANPALMRLRSGCSPPKANSCKTICIWWTHMANG